MHRLLHCPVCLVAAMPLLVVVLTVDSSKNSVTINKAEHLPAMDLNGLSDPFCRIVYDGKSQKTSVVRALLWVGIFSD